MRRAVRYDASASGRWLGYKPKQPCNDVQVDPAPPIGSFLGLPSGRLVPLRPLAGIIALHSAECRPWIAEACI